MKPKSIFIKCDVCGVYIGPAYHYKEFHDVGNYKICHPCYLRLNKEGYLYWQEDGQKLIEILFPDGTKTIVPREDIFLS